MTEIAVKLRKTVITAQETGVYATKPETWNVAETLFDNPMILQSKLDPVC